MPPANNFILFGNDVKAIASFTEIKSGLGNVEMSELNGGVHLLHHFLAELYQQAAIALARTDRIYLIKLFKNNQACYQVLSQLHVEGNEPDIKKLPVPINNRAPITTVIMPEYPYKVSDTAISRELEVPRENGVIYKMTRGFGGTDSLACLEKIKDKRPVIVVEADDLRFEGANLSRHLSWSRTVRDFITYMSDPTSSFKDIKDKLAGKTYHLIVRFDCDGVIYHKPLEKETTLFYCGSKYAEGDYVNSFGGEISTGASTAFTAALAFKLSETQGAFQAGYIEYAMKKACLFVSEGFKKGGYSFTYPGIRGDSAVTINKVEEIPDAATLDRPEWSILAKKNQERHMTYLQRAKDIVKRGPQTALGDVPTAQFNKLVTADREEMESFRAIANLVQEYLRSPQTKPLSIGVFGRPGSGKSFGVKQVVTTMASGQDKKVKTLEFNLSQFREYSELLAAFQEVRDTALSGETPLVLFDEFDSSFERVKLGWLQYFLAPMQDGGFLQHGRLRPLGPAIFVFIGGTSPTYKDFARGVDDAARAAKKPDFVSRLRGTVDIWGPDRISLRDRTYQIRRAIVLHTMLKMRLEKINVDEAVLNALLRVPQFHHGSRSLEAILNMSRLSGREKFERSALPSEHQLNLHVDSDKFFVYLKGLALADGSLARIKTIITTLDRQLGPCSDIIARRMPLLLYHAGVNDKKDTKLTSKLKMPSSQKNSIVGTISDELYEQIVAIDEDEASEIAHRLAEALVNQLCEDEE